MHLLDIIVEIDTHVEDAIKFAEVKSTKYWTNSTLDHGTLCDSLFDLDSKGTVLASFQAYLQGGFFPLIFSFYVGKCDHVHTFSISLSTTLSMFLVTLTTTGTLPGFDGTIFTHHQKVSVTKNMVSVVLSVIEKVWTWSHFPT